MKKIATLLFVFCLLPVVASAQSLSANMTGANEFPGPGDPDGSGVAAVTISGTTLTYTMLVQGLGTITGTRIHVGAAGTSGNILVNLDPTFSGGGAIGSVTITQAVANLILANPAGFYVNVYTTEFPDGAIRGQLVGGGGGQENPSICTPSDTAMCLSANRFRVEATWTTTPNNQTGSGHAVKVKEDSGYFWFFNADNIEMVVKVLNACSIGTTQWVFAGGLTDVQVTLKVTDTNTGVFKIYTNPQKQAFQPIQDTSAFACP